MGKKINFNSIRRGEVIGEHEVTFSSGKEIITLNHESFDRALYSEGALTAAKWLLNKKSGLYSARLAKKHGNFLKAMIFILKKMKHKKNRSAVFICSLSFKHPKKKLINVTGKIKGTITTSIRGKKGFGYDPIFKPLSHNITFGQMNKNKKIMMDHRYQAFKKLKRKIKIL